MGVSNENLGSPLKKSWDLKWKIAVSNEKLGVSNENLAISNEKLSLRWKSGGLQWKFGGLKGKDWGLQWIAWGLQSNLAISDEKLGVSDESLGVSNENLHRIVYIANIKCVDQKRVSKKKDYLFQVYGVVSVISGMAAIWSVTAIGKTIFQWTPIIF